VPGVDTFSGSFPQLSVSSCCLYLCGISFLLRLSTSSSLVFTLLLVHHHILSASPHHRPHLRSRQLSLHRPSTPNDSSVSQILSTTVFLVSSGLPSRILNLYRTKWALACVCFSFFFLLCFCFWLRVLD